MCEIQRLLDELGKTFEKFKELRRIEMLKAFANIRCCDCGHKWRLRNALVSANRRNRSTANRLIIACFIFLLFITALWLHLARQYNHATAYGSGGCISTFFYTAHDCVVQV